MKIKFYFFFILLFSLKLVAQNLEEKNNLIQGNNNYERKKYKEAETFYQNAIKGSKKSIIAKYNLANTLYKQEKTDEAISLYNQSNKLAKNKEQKSSIYHNLGNAYMKKQDYQKAIDAYKNSLLKNPLDNETRYNYALAKLMQKKAEDKKPKNQKEKEKKEKEKQDKKNQENKENQQEKNKTEKGNGDKEKNNEKKNEEGKNKGEKENKSKNNLEKGKKQSPKVDLKLMESLLKAVERNEKQTHKKIIENSKVFSEKKDTKDW